MSSFLVALCQGTSVVAHSKRQSQREIVCALGSAFAWIDDVLVVRLLRRRLVIVYMHAWLFAAGPAASATALLTTRLRLCFTCALGRLALRCDSTSPRRHCSCDWWSCVSDCALCLKRALPELHELRSLAVSLYTSFADRPRSRSALIPYCMYILRLMAVRCSIVAFCALRRRREQRTRVLERAARAGRLALQAGAKLETATSPTTIRCSNVPWG